jgi:hypothetical protein
MRKLKFVIGVLVAACAALAGCTATPNVSNSSARTTLVAPLGSVNTVATIRAALAAAPRGSQTIQATSDTGTQVFVGPGKYDLGTTPLLIPSCVTLDGTDGFASRVEFTYEGTGNAIRFYTYAGHGYHEGGAVRNISVVSYDGGIGIDPAVKQLVCARIEHVYLDCGGTPIKLRIPAANGDDEANVYATQIDDVVIRRCNGQAVDVAGRIQHISRLNVCNPTLSGPVTAPKFMPIAMVNLEGSGLCENSWFEGTFSWPLLRYASGAWTHTNNWLEPHQTSIAQELVDSARVVQDRVIFAEPEVPVVVRSFSSLTLLEHPTVTDVNGNASTNVAGAFQVDATSGAALPAQPGQVMLPALRRDSFHAVTK